MLSKIVIKATVIIALLSLGGCSFAPFSSSQSAHTIEKDAVSFQGGVALNGSAPYGRLNYGVTENLELGLLSEFHFADFVTGFVAKYGFLNNKEEGASFSVETSAGGGNSSTYAYVAPTIGYKKDKWDPYFSARYNYTRIGSDDFELDLGSLGKINFFEKTNLKYVTTTLGNTYWMTKKFGLNVNANYVLGSIDGFYAGAGFVYVFK